MQLVADLKSENDFDYTEVMLATFGAGLGGSSAFSGFPIDDEVSHEYALFGMHTFAVQLSRLKLLVSKL